MGLHIQRDDAASRERATMAEGSKAEFRVYETVDGELVQEGDPKGAFLVAGPGDPIPERHAKAYGELTEQQTMAAQTYTDDDVRADQRARQANFGAPMAATDPTQPRLLSDRRATELADEQRSIANMPVEARVEATQESAQAQGSGDVTVTPYAVGRSDDGELVHVTDERSATQAYAPGDTVAATDVRAYQSLGEPPEQDGDDVNTDGNTDVETKNAAPADNKARTTRRRA